MTTDVSVTVCPFVVLGAGGHAASVADVLASSGSRVQAFVGESVGAELPARAVSEDAAGFEIARESGAVVTLGIGDNALRCSVAGRVPVELRAPAVVAASATVAASAQTGRLTVVHHHAHIGPRAVVGEAVIVNTGAVVEHDAHVGDGAHIAPLAAVLGGASVGVEAFIGSGARVLPGVRVGDFARVGAGAVVVEDVRPSATVMGIPARERTQ